MGDVIKEPSKYELDGIVARVVDAADSIKTSLCDRCGNVWAKAGASKDNLHVFLCGHHFRKYVASLVGNGFAIHDPGDEMNFGGPIENRQQGQDH